ncbi:hypothetical protein [Leptolyngbya sp. FACHB-261]|nr:hypothetical protein [Leptolyngbya sp. FACHB-261]
MIKLLCGDPADKGLFLVYVHFVHSIQALAFFGHLPADLPRDSICLGKV